MTEGSDGAGGDQAAATSSATGNASPTGNTTPTSDVSLPARRPPGRNVGRAKVRLTRRARPHQTFATGRGEIPPLVPPDPIGPFIRPAGQPRLKRKDWPILVIALILAGLAMATCCVAGFAVYTGYGSRL